MTRDASWWERQKQVVALNTARNADIEARLASLKPADGTAAEVARIAGDRGTSNMHPHRN